MAKALAADAKYISDKIAQAQLLQLQSITKDDATIQLHFKETKPIQVRPCRQWRAFCTSAPPATLHWSPIKHSVKDIS